MPFFGNLNSSNKSLLLPKEAQSHELFKLLLIGIVFADRYVNMPNGTQMELLNEEIKSGKGTRHSLEAASPERGGVKSEEKKWP